ncbi:MAG: phosphopantetheinyl transferase (holo-ACP synthase), partial [Saprospiraceae bacterium]
TKEEKDMLFSSNQMHMARWRLWSCKESVYKVLIKSGVSPFLNPLRIEVVPDEPWDKEQMRFKAIFDGRKIGGCSFKKDHWVHSISSNQPFTGHDYHSEIIKVAEKSASEQIRVLVKKKLEKEHDIKVENIFQSSLNIPTIICQDKEIGVDFSISHHAPYSAYILHIYNRLSLNDI